MSQAAAMPRPVKGRLETKTAIVTGAASGNGLAVARRMLAEGASVALVDVNQAALDAIAFDTDDRQHITVKANVADPDEADRAIAATVKEFGKVDILVNNAGIVRRSDFDELSLEEWNEVLAVNASGAFNFARAAAPSMKSGSGHRTIINITSIEAHIVIASSGHPQVHYNASKGALLMFSRALAVEMSRYQITVNAIAPGIIETPLTSGALADQSRKAWFVDRIPLGRIGRPEDVAAAAAFLASDDASYITGTTLFVDGGWTVA
jgi:NAD(P)-dependent dehydrogenase (short-subunit alcohol dehydrogenase family)